MSFHRLISTAKGWFCLMLLAGNRTLASMCLQEPFNYASGTLGNDSPWTSPTSLIAVTNTSMVWSNLTDLSPASQSVVVLPGTTALSYRPLSSTASSGVVYFSFLMNFLSKPGNYYIGGLLQST